MKKCKMCSVVIPESDSLCPKCKVQMASVIIVFFSIAFPFSMWKLYEMQSVQPSDATHATTVTQAAIPPTPAFDYAAARQEFIDALKQTGANKDIISVSSDVAGDSILAITVDDNWLSWPHSLQVQAVQMYQDSWIAATQKNGVMVDIYDTGGNQVGGIGLSGAWVNQN